MLLRIFTESILCHFWNEDRCGSCGKIKRQVTVRAPTRFEEKGKRVHVIIPYQCQCGQRGGLEINMPTELFSYILLRLVMLAHCRCKSKVERSFVPKRSELFDYFLEDFQSNSRPSRGASAPKAESIPRQEMQEFLNSLDAEDFAVPDTGWAEILRKMGFDPEKFDSESSV